jgi:branched-chain amino acid transport system permease protein
MFELIGVPPQALFGQLLLGLINGSFYAILSLGLALIFGMLNIINFAHGALYMTGAFVAWMLLQYTGIGYWWALLLAPIVVGAFGMVLERTMLSRLYKLDHLYGLLLTFGLTLIIEGLFRHFYGVSGQPYPIPEVLRGGQNLGFMFLPNYRAWVVVAALAVCLIIWYVIERTRLGAYLRAGTENPVLVQAFGINVPRMITLTYGLGVTLAAFAGVLAAPIYNVSPLMGSNLIIVVFAVVVIGGMGSILGAVVTGLGLGVIEGLTKVFYPEASATVIFIIMAIVLLVLALIAPFFVYPVFLMKMLCFALFACSFNLLLGYGGLLSFGHAAFFGSAAYIAAHTIRVMGFTPELGILAGTAVAGLLGVVIGVLAIRRLGIYFAMVTLAFAQMVYFFALQAPFTGGEDGIQAVPRGLLLGLIDLRPDLNLYYLVLAIFVFGFLVIYRTIHSPFGQVLKAIRENEPRAVSLGYRTDQYKLATFVLSATLAGLAGATTVLVFQLASLTYVHWHTSGEVVLMTLLGGMGTVFGPVVGAFIVVTLQNYLAPLGAWVTVILGTIFVVCVLTFRRGIVGELGAFLAKRLRVRRPEELSAEAVLARAFGTGDGDAARQRSEAAQRTTGL